MPYTPLQSLLLIALLRGVVLWLLRIHGSGPKVRAGRGVVLWVRVRYLPFRLLVLTSAPLLPYKDKVDQLHTPRG